MSEEEHSFGSDINDNNSDEVGFHNSVDLDLDEQDRLESDVSQGSSSSDSEESEEEEDEEDRLCEQNISELIYYATGYSNEEVTLEGLKERVDRIPTNIVAEKFLEKNVLHDYVEYHAECHPGGGLRDEEFPAANIRLEVVQYMLELAPDAVHQVHEVQFGRNNYRGAYPLHYACFNADCPESVVQLLLERNPSAAKFYWEKGHGLPLSCYLRRACKHVACGYHDEEGEWEESDPAHPSGELDYETVKMLVLANPDALTLTSVSSESMPLNILCQGYSVSLDLAQMLTDKVGLCLEIDKLDKEKYHSPIWSLLRNTLVTPFPDNVFRYLLGLNPSSLEMKPSDLKCRSYNPSECMKSETPLNIACENPNMTAETVGLIINSQPEMVKNIYKLDACLPLHTLCKNKNLGEQASIDILKLLLDAYPESVKIRIRGGAASWILGTNEGKSPIHLAEENMSFSFCKTLLLERSRLSSIKANILQVACIAECSLDLIKKLVDDDPGLLLMEDRDGRIALQTAVRFAMHEVTQYLVDRMKPLLSEGMYPSSMSSKVNILHLALFYDCPIVVIKKLVEDDPELLLKKYKEQSALNVAVSRYLDLAGAKNSASLDVIKFLVTRNEDLLAVPDETGALPLHITLRFDQISASHLARRFIPGIALVIKKKTLELVQYLVDRNESTLDMPDKNGELPLHVAAKFVSLEIVECLVRGRNDSSLITPDKMGELPLHKACRFGNVAAVKFLMVQNLASVTMRNHKNEMPVHLLCNKTDKSDEVLQSVDYTGRIYRLLRHNPEICDC